MAVYGARHLAKWLVGWAREFLQHAACARRTARGRSVRKKSRTCVPLARYSQQTRRSKCVAASSGCFAWAIGFPHTTPVLNLFARIRFMSRLLCTNKSIRWYCKQTSMPLPALSVALSLWYVGGVGFEVRSEGESDVSSFDSISQLCLAV